MVVNGAYIFVGGPIQNAIGQDGSFCARTRFAIERSIAGLRHRGYKVLSAHLYENFGEMDMCGKCQEVCSRDFQWMRQCDLFVAVLPLDRGGNVICSSGTSVELGWASVMGKPIVLVCDPEAKYSHLVIGLDAVARVAKIDINGRDFDTALCGAVAAMLGLPELADL